MLREYERGLARARSVFYVLLSAVVYTTLAMQPGLQREGVTTRSGLVSLLVLGGLVIVGWPMLLGRIGIFQSQRREGFGTQIVGVLLAAIAGTLTLAGVAFLLDAPVSPMLPALIGATLFGVHLCVTVPAFYLLHSLRRAGRNYRNVLVIGAGPRAHSTLRTIEEHPEWGYRVIGFIDDGVGEFTPAVPQEQVFKYADVPHMLREESVDELLVACPRSMLSSLAPIVNECALIGVPVTMLTDLFGDQLPPPRVGRFAGMNTLTFAPVHHGEFELLVKRCMDVVGAIVGLLISAPIIAAAAAAIRLTSRGPVFFKQVRSGRYGHSFEMIKLRTMVPDAERRRADLLHLNEMDGPVFKIQHDPRITPVGSVLRKFSIDELPQFWNVLRGDMSIVGPRPPTPDEVQKYVGSDRRRLSMRPGLTCLWQISGRNEVSFEEWMKLDLEYIDTWSLAKDVEIIARTVPEVLTARGAS